MGRSALSLGLLLLGACACDPKVVDAVHEPLPAPVPTPTMSAPMMEPEPEPEPKSPLELSLLHRYSFDGTGTEVADSRGAAHGTLLGTELRGDGLLALGGERSGEYVDLPNGIVSGLHDATFEAWLTWDGGEAWQRLFDFGSNTAGEGEAGRSGVTYLFFAMSSSSDAMPAGTPRLVFSKASVGGEEICATSEPFPAGVLLHVAAVVDSGQRRMAIYQDGQLLVECPFEGALSALEDVNNWLGHSNFVADVDLSATYEEFRIYGVALTPSELAASFAAGPDAGR